MRKLTAVLFASLLGIAVSGCERQEGPAERAGKEVDRAMEKADTKIKDAASATGEKMQEAGEALKQKAGQ
ncbi:MAG TPA: hypothetical protein GX399_11725 [Xanthomonadaceae bacterium]|nr:hypothetical protein [Xanthomonadaceae bacterium]